MTGDTKYSINRKDIITDYSETTKQHFKESGKDIILNDINEIDSLVDDAYKHIGLDRFIHYGVLKKSVVDNIRNSIQNYPKTGWQFNQDNYELAIKEDSFLHFTNKKSKLTKEDVKELAKRLPDIIANFDEVIYSKDENGEGLRFKKSFKDGNYVSFTLTSDKKNRLLVKSISMDKETYSNKKRNISPTANDKSLAKTSKTDGLSVSYVDNIPQNEQKVNSGISNNSNMQNKEKDAVKNSIELDNSSFSLDELPKVKEGYTRLYRGLNNDYDSNYDRSTLDSPNGYDTLTDNYDLAKQYGKNVYYIDIPTNQIANSVIDENPNSETYGDRHLVYKDDKPASINGVSGNEYLLYTDHDSFDSNNYHKVEKQSISNPDIRYSIEPTMNDATTMDSKSLKALTKNMKQQLGLNRVQVNELEQIIQKHSKSGELNKDSIYKDIKDRFSKQSIESDIQEVKDVQRLIRNTKIDVSQNIKNDIADYNKLKQRNFGKIKFSSDGQPVDVVYQELSNEYPNYFPDDIYNESDQFKKIVEVANYDNKVLEEYDIDDNYIRETSDYIYDSIRDYHLDQRKKLANEELDLINSEYSKKPKKNTPIKYTDEQIAKILDRGSTKNISFKEDMRRKLAITTANVIDKGYYIEKLARKTGNSRLDALYDNTLFSSSQAQEIIGNGRFEVNTPQKIGLKATLKTKKGVASAETKVGDSLYDIYEPIENSGKQKEFEEYMYHKLNVERMTLDKRYGEENKRVFAESIGADKSREFIKKLEAKNPEFKEWAKKVYEYESNDKYSDMATLVESGIMSKEQAQKYLEFLKNNEEELTINQLIRKSLEVAKKI